MFWRIILIFWEDFPSSPCMVTPVWDFPPLSLLTCVGQNMSLDNYFHIFFAEEDVFAPLKSQRFKHPLGNIGMVHHKCESQSSVEILLLPVSLFPLKLGCPSSWNHTVIQNRYYLCLPTTNALLASASYDLELRVKRFLCAVPFHSS